MSDKQASDQGGLVPSSRQNLQTPASRLVRRGLEDLKVLKSNLHSYNAESHIARGKELMEKGDWAGAIDAFREAVRLQSDVADAHYNLAEALLCQGKRESAIEVYREAIRLHSDWVEAHNALGWLLISGKDLDSAVVEFREAIRINPDHIGAHTGLQLALYKIQKGDLEGS